MEQIYNSLNIKGGSLLLWICLPFLFGACDMLGVHDPVEAKYPCINGQVQTPKQQYPCHRIDLVSRLTPEQLGGERLNDIWGWTDPATYRRYALVGVNNGVTFVEITQPSNPQVLGRLPSHPDDDADDDHEHKIQSAAPAHPQHASIWGDMKVYRNYMYAVSEEEGHGVHVFDLRRLRGLREDSDRLFQVDTIYRGLSTAHNININTDTGFLYAVGTGGKKCRGSGLHIINIQNPAAPSFAGCYHKTGYIHDTQCVVYHGPDKDYKGDELCFNSNADKFSIVNVTDKQDPTLVSTLTYEGLGFVHQGWLTEDHRFFLLGDELDELKFNHDLRTYVLNLQDLDNPRLKFYKQADTPSIDHNQYIKGQYVYQSNYTSGLFVLNLDQIDGGKLRKVAYFDTHPKNNHKIFDGSWSNYPFFNQDMVIVSDISGGLFILHPRLP